MKYSNPIKVVLRNHLTAPASLVTFGFGLVGFLIIQLVWSFEPCYTADIGFSDIMRDVNAGWLLALRKWRMFLRSIYPYGLQLYLRGFGPNRPVGEGYRKQGAVKRLMARVRMPFSRGQMGFYLKPGRKALVAEARPAGSLGPISSPVQTSKPPRASGTYLYYAGKKVKHSALYL